VTAASETAFSGKKNLSRPARIRRKPVGRGGAALPPPPESLRADQHAFFLDLDGTLIEFAPHPNEVTVDAELLGLLQQLALRSRGALALVSGRSIADIDALLDPLRLPASGLHGFERRSPTGVHTHHTLPCRQMLEDARHLMAQLIAKDARLTLEDKGYALALHFRQAPQLEGAILEALEAIPVLVDGGLALRHGPMVVELTPSGVSKASAIAEFMSEQPFKGRRPLCVGDDLNDEPAFEWVNAADGLSVAVNVTRPTAARTKLRSVGEVRVWLHGLIDGSGQ
jgi:trehalose 6-phosphate phosphatase